MKITILGKLIYAIFTPNLHTSTIMVNEIGSKFNSQSCPANLPLWDDGIAGQPKKIAFKDVVASAAKRSDIVMFGDTDHFNPKLHGIAAEDGVLAAIKEAKFTHITLEVPRNMQHWVDKFYDGQHTRAEFEKKIHMALAVSQGNENGEWTKQIGKMAEFAKGNGIKLIFADPENGRGYCSQTLKGDALEACQTAAEKERFEDTELSALLAETLESTPNAKIFQVYGAAHYSVDYSNKELINGNITKIDVYQNRLQYEGDRKYAAEPDSHNSKMEWNKIKPELIYMIDEGSAYTTCNTPTGLSKDIREISDKNEKPDEQKLSRNSPTAQTALTR